MKRLCAEPGCSSVIAESFANNYCNRHRKRPNRSAQSPQGYGNAHRVLRLSLLAEFPICQVPGCDKPSVEADHIVPRAVAPERALDRTNYQALCKPHHSEKTMYESAFGRKRITAEQAWDRRMGGGPPTQV